MRRAACTCIRVSQAWKVTTESLTSQGSPSFAQGGKMNRVSSSRKVWRKSEQGSGIFRLGFFAWKIAGAATCFPVSKPFSLCFLPVQFVLKILNSLETWIPEAWKMTQQKMQIELIETIYSEDKCGGCMGRWCSRHTALHVVKAIFNNCVLHSPI